MNNDEAIANALLARGIPATPENIRKVYEANRKKKAPKGPSQLEQIGLGIAGTAGAGLASVVGNKAGQYVSNALSSAVTPTATYQSPLAGMQFGATGPVATTGTTGGASSLGSTLGSAATIAGGALGAYGLYDTIEGSRKKAQRGGDLAMTAGQGALSGAAIGSAVPIVGTGLGALIGGGIGLASGYFGSDKDIYQSIGRDEVIRDKWQDRGLIDDQYMMNGVDLGKDGGFRFDDGRKIYEVIAGQEDGAVWDDPRTAEDVSALNALGVLTSEGNIGDIGGMTLDNLKGMATGMAYNGLLENDGQITGDELRSLYDKMGGHEKVISDLGALHNAGKLNDDVFAMQNAVNQVYGRQSYGDGVFKDYEEDQRVRNDIGDLIL